MTDDRWSRLPTLEEIIAAGRRRGACDYYWERDLRQNWTNYHNVSDQAKQNFFKLQGWVKAFLQLAVVHQVKGLPGMLDRIMDTMDSNTNQPDLVAAICMFIPIITNGITNGMGQSVESEEENHLSNPHNINF